MEAEHDRLLELAEENDRLRSKLRRVISHATMGHCDDDTLSLNDICVRISAGRNKFYQAGIDKGRALAQEPTT